MKFHKFETVNTLYKPVEGSFAVGKKVDGEYQVNRWFYCREIFHHHTAKAKIIFFAHKPATGKYIAKFLAKIEDMLDVTPRSEFGPTQRRTIMWIRPSRWWTERSMKRSLLTALLRAGLEYVPSKGNFREALYSCAYLAKTMYAVERFLAGYTHYTGRKRGWYKQFHSEKPTKEKIDSLLIKP